MDKSVLLDKIKLGVCYYPEHWPESLWADDLTRMRDCGIEFVRVGEFAWSKIEPLEGIFSFELFDRFLDLAAKNGIKVIFGTPTATPPIWLTEKYPEVLNAHLDGTLLRHGMRRHYNYNCEVYKRFVAEIVERLASHYCAHSAIIGWQIDNELNCETNVFYSQSDHKAFREYMREKFVTLKALNEAMGTVFWNQTYSSWDEVYLTRTTINDGLNNPHMSLEEKRFISKSTIAFCCLQANIIRKHLKKGQFITTNGIFGHLDSHEMTKRALDFFTYDSYPNFAFGITSNPKSPGNLNDRNSSWNLSRVRSVSQNFGIMEQQSGAGGWDTRMKQPAPKPGQMRLWSFQSLAHGADFISFFRWRTSPVGTEIYWHGLNDYSNLPNRRITELQQINQDFIKISSIVGSRYKANIAIVKDYDNEWDGEQDIWHGPLEDESVKNWFSAAQLTHTPLDVLYLENRPDYSTAVEDLAKYKMLIYPHATILTFQTAELLKAYVAQGGTLVMGARTGYKDEYGRCPMQPMPGYAGEICGVRVTDYTALGPNDEIEYVIWNNEILEAPIFNDILEPLPGARVLAHFKGNYYDGEPALVANDIGSGTAYYYGAGFSFDAAVIFLQKLGFAEPYSSLLKLPAEAELAVRSKDGDDYFFVLNYMPTPITAILNEPMNDLITGRQLNGEVKIEKYGVLVLKK